MSFISALILLLGVLYMFAIVCMNGILTHLTELNVHDLSKPSVSNFVYAVKDKYGSIPVTLHTLFAAVTGGYDWADVAATLEEVGPFYRIAFVCYVSFVLLGLMNILNGVFVNAALQSSAMNRELAIDAAVKRRNHMISEMVAIFLEAGAENVPAEIDPDASLEQCLFDATVTWEQFQANLEDEGMKAYFMALDLDTASLEKIFRLLDVDDSGTLDLEELVDGCIRLRGSAKNVDISMLESQMHYQSKNMERQLERFSSEMDRLQASVTLSFDGFHKLLKQSQK
jgi:hypothetical protein